MRLWTVHPRHLDAAGLVAVWREALLARAVLRGRTRGYRHHPQLQRFRAHPRPIECIDAFLAGVHAEAVARGYHFDARKFTPPTRRIVVTETRGQLEHEWAHLKRKLRQRSPARYRAALVAARPGAHPLFRIVSGDVKAWERA
jgi:hypothetical protein